MVVRDETKGQHNRKKARNAQSIESRSVALSREPKKRTKKNKEIKEDTNDKRNSKATRVDQWRLGRRKAVRSKDLLDGKKKEEIKKAEADKEEPEENGIELMDGKDDVADVIGSSAIEQKNGGVPIDTNEKGENQEPEKINSDVENVSDDASSNDSIVVQTGRIDEEKQRKMPKRRELPRLEMKEEEWRCQFIKEKNRLMAKREKEVREEWSKRVQEENQAIFQKHQAASQGVEELAPELNGAERNDEIDRGMAGIAQEQEAEKRAELRRHERKIEGFLRDNWDISDECILGKFGDRWNLALQCLRGKRKFRGVQGRRRQASCTACQEILFGTPLRQHRSTVCFVAKNLQYIFFKRTYGGRRCEICIRQMREGEDHVCDAPAPECGSCKKNGVEGRYDHRNVIGKCVVIREMTQALGRQPTQEEMDKFIAPNTPACQYWVDWSRIRRRSIQEWDKWLDKEGKKYGWPRTTIMPGGQNKSGGNHGWVQRAEE